VAAFLHVNRRDCKRIVIYPLRLIKCNVLCTLSHFVVLLGNNFLTPWTINNPQHAEWVADTIPKSLQYLYAASTCTVAFGGFFLPSAFRLWNMFKSNTREHVELIQQLRNFTVAAAECRDESDRAFVEQQISEWFGDVAAFEQYVQGEVASQVTSILEAQGLYPLHAVVVAAVIPQVLFMSNIVALGLADDSALLRSKCMLMIACPCSVTLALNMAMWLSKTRLGEDRPGVSSLRRKLEGPLVCVAFVSVLYGMSLALLAPCPLWFQVSWCLMQMAAVCLVYSYYCFRPRARDL